MSIVELAREWILTLVGPKSQFLLTEMSLRLTDWPVSVPIRPVG